MPADAVLLRNSNLKVINPIYVCEQPGQPSVRGDCVWTGVQLSYPWDWEDQCQAERFVFTHYYCRKPPLKLLELNKDSSKHIKKKAQVRCNRWIHVFNTNKVKWENKIFSASAPEGASALACCSEHRSGDYWDQSSRSLTAGQPWWRNIKSRPWRDDQPSGAGEASRTAPVWNRMRRDVTHLNCSVFAILISIKIWDCLNKCCRRRWYRRYQSRCWCSSTSKHLILSRKQRQCYLK